MSRIDELIAEPCPVGVEFSRVGEIAYGLLLVVVRS